MPAVQPQPPLEGSPGATTVPAREPEREFIRGNRDGPGDTSETYTVCRLRVSKERLDQEMSLGLHPHFLSLATCWDCPAQIFLKAAKKREQRLSTGAVSTLRPPPAAAPLSRWQSSTLTRRPAEGLEIIQRESGPSGDAATYTVCRVAVPRERLVLEVIEELHPGYCVRRKKGAGLAASDPRRLYVKGKPTEPFDNVDFPKSRRAGPGFGPRDLCPFRLLRPGPQLAALGQALS